VDALLFMGSNQPVKISDAKSGIIRRLIDVHPSGIKLPPKHYQTLMTQISFELGAIAHRCLSVYLSMGKNYYNAYRPLEMMLQTDVFFNFIEAHYDIFKSQNQTTLKQAYALYKTYCEESGIDRPLPQYKMREELRNYFDEFHDRGEIDGERVRSLYQGFNAEKFKAPKTDPTTFSLVMEETTSLLDEFLKTRRRSGERVVANSDARKAISSIGVGYGGLFPLSCSVCKGELNVGDDRPRGVRHGPGYCRLLSPE